MKTLEITGKINSITYASWTIVLITNITGITNIPWNYVLVPIIVLSISTAIMVVGFFSNKDSLMKFVEELDENKFKELAEKNGYEIKKKDN